MYEIIPLVCIEANADSKPMNLELTKWWQKVMEV